MDAAKMMSMCALAAFAGWSAAAAPAVSGTPALRISADTVEVDYELAAGADAVVTVSFETNTLADASGEWVAIPESATTRLSGDVNRRVTPGTPRRLRWRPDFRASAFSASTLRAVLTPWPVSQPPPYMVVDLRGLGLVRYFVSTNALPDGGLSNDIYRRTKLVLRRIPAKDVVWRMGNPGASGWRAPHYVTFSSDYYLGIYEMTEHQLRTGAGQVNRPLTLHPATHGSGAELSYALVRGGNWPDDAKGEVGADTLLAKMQAVTGVPFDLPTAAEWEYACRAGTSGTYNVAGSMSSKCWCIGSLKETGLSGSQPVGLLRPNNWGLYDMHGNILELCLDRYEDVASTYTDMDEPEPDPKGSLSASATIRVARGGNWADGESAATQDKCNGISEDEKKKWIGFRVWAPAEAR